MTEPTGLEKLIEELRQIHSKTKASCGHDIFELDNLLMVVRLCLPKFTGRNDARIARIVEDLKKSLFEANEEKIETHKEELITFFEGATE